MLVSDEIPDTREKNTKGTINNLSKLMKIALPKLKTYLVKKSVRLSGKTLT
jgi:hypothetical protein